MTKEKVDKLFENLKREILSMEMQIAYPAYPKLIITEFDDEMEKLSKAAICGNDMHIYVNKKWIIDAPDMYITEVLVHELYHYMYPGSRLLIFNDLEEIEFTEAVVQSKTIEYCSRHFKDFKTHWNINNYNTFSSYYKPARPEYWLACQILFLYRTEINEDKHENCRMVFSSIYTMLSLSSVITILVETENDKKILEIKKIGIQKIIDKLIELHAIYCYCNMFFDIKICDADTIKLKLVKGE